MTVDQYLARNFDRFSRHPDPRVRRATLHAIAGTMHEETLERVMDDLELSQEMELEQEGWDG